MPLEKEQVSKAVKALVKHVKSSSQDNQLLGSSETVLLMVGLKTVPLRTSKKPQRVLIPHTLFEEDESEICLFTKDPQDEFQELLKKNGVTCVSKVIGISKLKEKHSKSHEQKRQLLNSYDLFLADDRIIPLLPSLLGRKFFEKKKQPIPVNMKAANLKQEIAHAKDATYVHLGLGSCVMVRIGSTGQTDEQIIENIMAGMEGVVDKIPHKWANVQSVHIKTSESVSLPIYASVPTLEITDVAPAAYDTPSWKVARDSRASVKRQKEEKEAEAENTPTPPVTKKAKVEKKAPAAKTPVKAKTPAKTPVKAEAMVEKVEKAIPSKVVKTPVKKTPVKSTPAKATPAK
eukprot:Ihof_evm2s725 gene=Ihof_evmTU2s725